MKDQNGNTSLKGDNIFGEIGKDKTGNPVYFGSTYQCYDWVSNSGRDNIGAWIKAAAEKAGR